MKFNLSAWALQNRSIVLYLMILFGVALGCWGLLTMTSGWEPQPGPSLLLISA